VAIPETMIVRRENRREVMQALGLPCVLKLPDSSFSKGVVKATTAAEFEEHATRMLSSSDLLIAQEFIPTDFDWRIGVLEGRALYACKYFMARDHWKIYDWDSGKQGPISGGWETVAIDDAPPDVVATALKASKLVGNGLYGVDLKHIGDRLTFEMHLERLGVVASAFARLTLDIYVGEEVHLELDDPGALAGFAAPSFHVERESSRAVPANLGFWKLRKNVADMAEETRVRRRIGARSPADGPLVNVDHLVHEPRAIHAVVRERDESRAVVTVR